MLDYFDDHLSELFEEAESFSCDSIDILAPSFQTLSQVPEKYTVKEIVGEGGMKKVFRVYDNLARREVALAVLRDEKEIDCYDTFIHEAWLTSKLDHPNIIKVHDVGVNENNAPFFTMDLKSGHSLKELLCRQNPQFDTIDKLLEVFIKVCDAVSYAHSKHILHLDIKPDNIQVGSFGGVVVCDWGLGKLIKLEESSEIDVLLLNSELRENIIRDEELVRGTPGFMAPEQYHGMKKVDKRTDVFGLGALLYTMLEGNPPFDGEVIGTAIKGFSRKVPKSLEAVVKKCLHIDPEFRYESVKSLRDDLNNFRYGYSTVAEEASFVKEILLFYHRNKKISQLVISFFLFIVTIVMVFMIKLDGSRREEKSARQDAIANLKLANESKRRTEYALKLYKQEKKSFESLMRDFIDDTFENESYLRSPGFYRNPLMTAQKVRSKLDKILAHNPNLTKILKQKVHLSFVMQNYKEVGALISQHSVQGVIFVKKAMSEFNLLNKDHLTVEEFVELLDYLSKLKTDSSPLFSKLIAADFKLRKSRKESVDGYEKAVKKCLMIYNPGWKNSVFDYDTQLKTLKISGRGFKRLSSLWHGDLPLIRFLELDKLIVNSCDIYDLRQLDTLKIKELDICDTYITDFEPLKSFSELKRLTVLKAQYTEQQLKQVPPHIEVILK